MKVTGVLGLAVGAALLGIAFAQPAQAQCLAFAVTTDGGNKENAVERSQAALQQAVAEWARDNKRTVRSMRPHPAQPYPFWRDRVTPDLMLKPDVRTAQMHTVCWRGVISPAVCTTGSRVC